MSDSTQPANDNRKKPRRRKQEEKEITAYPRDYWEDAPDYARSKVTYTTAYLRRLGWCLECKENPCECYEPGDVWIDPE